MSKRLRLLVALAGTIACGVALGDLSYAAHYPDAYGFNCSRGACALAFPLHSFELLRHGGTSEALLFVAIWLMTAWIIALPFWVAPRSPSIPSPKE